MNTPEPDHIEQVRWFSAARPHRPDAEITVTLQLTDDAMPIAQGWWDGEDWCLCESGGKAPAGSVLAWADVVGVPAEPAADAEAVPLSEIERLQNDLAMAQFAGMTGQMHLSALVGQLRGERGVMLGLLRDLLEVVETITAESCDESGRLERLTQQAQRLLVAVDSDGL